ncbi:sigma-70 family RNA polymerase sigma factor [Streptomyces sp. NPDC096033]|uniref:sigma-70 family RNA polymerase sigma factor n=1 Tax=Streptomyces sp. NPDC096033 TaxID=3366071 RepID=UPI003822F551
MDEKDELARRFDTHRAHLRAVAYRMLGSLGDADDAVQEAWFRLNRTDVGAVENLGGWLTTVVGRVCLDMLRSRTARREESLDAADLPFRMPDPVVGLPGRIDPEQEALLADSVGIALMVVLESLAPAERLAFVLHDMFAVPFEEIAPLVEKSSAATRQLASRARRRVRGAAPAPDTDPVRVRRAVDAFLSAARDGDLEALVAVLDPEITARSDGGTRRPGALLRGARRVASQAIAFARFAQAGRAVLVNGGPGVLALDADGHPVSLMAFTVRGGLITTLDILTDPDRLAGIRLDVA